MATTEELINALQSRILEIEKSLEEIRSRPATPDRATEIEALKKEISELRRDLAEANKEKKGQAPKGDDDLALGHFGGE